MTDELDRILNDLILHACDYEAGKDVDLDAKANEALFAIQALIDQECNKARIEGAKNYNRILTDNLGQHEYTAIGLDGIVGVYRQETVGVAIRKANNETIMTKSTKGLAELSNKDTK